MDVFVYPGLRNNSKMLWFLVKSHQQGLFLNLENPDWVLTYQTNKQELIISSRWAAGTPSAFILERCLTYYPDEEVDPFGFCSVGLNINQQLFDHDLIYWIFCPDARRAAGYGDEVGEQTVLNVFLLKCSTYGGLYGTYRILSPPSAVQSSLHWLHFLSSREKHIEFSLFHSNKRHVACRGGEAQPSPQRHSHAEYL